MYGNVIRLLMPLTVPFDELAEGLGMLEGAFIDCLEKK